MRRPCPRVANGDLGAALWVVVRIGPVGHDREGEGDDGFVLGRVGTVAAGAEAGSVVRHVASVGGGENGEESQDEGDGLHNEGCSNDGRDVKKGVAI